MADSKPIVRCAVYTRKSSEEGLEQSFNSLDAQREACVAFIVSQKHEGWRQLSAKYDDGGFSGGTMERPALKRLLDDICASKIDTVVVYKVDRLTRSLADFAKIIELFDSHKISFVSVTQQFNTTTSMGRLTLNVLLSFAQFEREVTGERIRDKIAASKKKGMWMGGTVPLGYDVKHRKLIVNPNEANDVREIFRQYLRLGCVSKLKIHLESKGIRSKLRVNQVGRRYGGAIYSRGALYKILQNRIYLGEVAHKGHVYEGEHDGIVPRDVWQKVQAQLATNNNVHAKGLRSCSSSLLTGLVFDQDGERFTPTHAVKNNRRYRYYVSQVAIKNPGRAHSGPVRIPASDLEQLVCSELKSFLTSSHRILKAASGNNDSAAEADRILTGANDTLAQVNKGINIRKLVLRLIPRIEIRDETIHISVNRRLLRNELLGSRTKTDADLNGCVTLKKTLAMKRIHGQTRLVIPPIANQDDVGNPVPSLIKAVALARDWFHKITVGKINNMQSIAQTSELSLRHVRRILRCAFLAPEIVQCILKGKQPPAISLSTIRTKLALGWADQKQIFGFVESLRRQKQ